MTAVVVSENYVNLGDYDIQKVPEDGDCMYHCILQATILLDKKPGTEFVRRGRPLIPRFRRAVAKEFENDDTLFPEFNEDGTVAFSKKLGRQMKMALVKSIRDGHWGDSTIAAKVEKMYTVPITIVDEKTSLVVNARPVSPDGIILLWRNNHIHYDWLLRKDEASLKF